MTRRIRSLNGGRARVWWIHHGREAIRALQLAFLVACFLAVSHFDYQDQIDQARAAHAAIREQVARSEQVFGPPAPPTVFVLEARTVQDLDMRLAEIAGDLDTWRLKNRGRQ